MATGYVAPGMRVLGSVSDLTRAPSPPGKSGVVHDGSQFLSNFSCVVNNNNCGGH
jgi:hypothetical protein